MPLYFNLVGTIADVDETTPDNLLHPSLLLETAERIERVVLPRIRLGGTARAAADQPPATYGG